MSRILAFQFTIGKFIYWFRFEVQLQDFDWSPSQTGFIGAKLYRSAGYDITKGNDGPYTIAFGLNLESKKIKFDVAQWTPIHSEYRISSYASSVEFPTDSKVHYYTLHVKLNATFSIYIDGVKAHEGDFLKVRKDFVLINLGFY